MLLVTAGSETTSSALTMLIFELIKNPEWIVKMRNELLIVFAGEDVSEMADFDKLTKECPVLNACINEILRLWPPVMSGLSRETPKRSPLTVRLRDQRSIVIPPNTNVVVPFLAVHRDPRNFSPKPDHFRPDRWLEPEKEEVFNQKAYFPFLYGPRNCVGKQFAYEEMRTFIAQFVMRFDFRFAPTFDADAFLDGIREYTAQSRTKPLLVSLTARL